MSLQEQFSAEEPRGGSVAAFPMMSEQTPHHHRLVYWAQCFCFHVLVLPEFVWLHLSPPTPPPRPTAAPLQNARWSETRGPRGILLLSNCCHQPWFCLHTAASLSLFWLPISATATFLFFLYDRLLVSTHCGNNFFIFILFVIFGVKSFCLFLKLPSTEPGSLTFHMNLHINIILSSP